MRPVGGYGSGAYDGPGRGESVQGQGASSQLNHAANKAAVGAAKAPKQPDVALSLSLKIMGDMARSMLDVRLKKQDDPTKMVFTFEYEGKRYRLDAERVDGEPRSLEAEHDFWMRPSVELKRDRASDETDEMVGLTSITLKHAQIAPPPQRLQKEMLKSKVDGEVPERKVNLIVGVFDGEFFRFRYDLEERAPELMKTREMFEALINECRTKTGTL